MLRVHHDKRLNLRANASRAGPVYWFADAAFVGSVPAGQDLSWLPPAAGRYTIAAVDAAGASDTRDIAVEFAP